MLDGFALTSRGTMTDSFFYLLRWPLLRVCLGIYLVFVVVGAFWFLRRRPLASAASVGRRRWQLSLYLALCFTPSIITDYFVAGFVGPASVGFIFTAPLLFWSGQPFNALRALAFLYALPVAVVYGLLFAAFPWFSRCFSRRTDPAV